MATCEHRGHRGDTAWQQREAQLILGGESRATWDFEQDALQQRGIENSSTAIDHGTQRLTIEEAKRLATAQPARDATPPNEGAT